MEIPLKMRQVLQHEGVVAIVTQNNTTPHLVNTWNSYIHITPDNCLLVPVGGMKQTENNLTQNPHVLMTLGSREVDGFHSKGTGFLIKATAHFSSKGSEYDVMKAKFPWCRAILKIHPQSITQTL